MFKLHSWVFFLFHNKQQAQIQGFSQLDATKSFPSHLLPLSPFSKSLFSKSKITALWSLPRKNWTHTLLCALALFLPLLQLIKLCIIVCSYSLNYLLTWLPAFTFVSLQCILRKADRGSIPIPYTQSSTPPYSTLFFSIAIITF